MSVEWWALYVPGVLIVAAGWVIFYWLGRLQRRSTEHGERIAHLEGASPHHDQ